MTYLKQQLAQIQKVQVNTGSVLFRCQGDWTAKSLQDVVKYLQTETESLFDLSIKWDVTDVVKVDSAGMMLYIHYHDLLKLQHCTVELMGARSEYKDLYQLLRCHISPQAVSKPDLLSRLLNPFSHIGKSVADFCQDINDFLTFIGENSAALLTSIQHPSSIRYASIVKNIEEAGVRALPIIALTSCLIGVVITYQGALQLQKFGANIFIVDMIGISVTRELAPLITAIVVAGRTGSSYTAQLGAMTITEEISAMRTMGFEPHRFLVLPRIIALMIAMPLLILFADIIGIAGGMVVSNIHLNISYAEFIHRLQNVLDIKHLWIGLLKGPFFAWLIAVTGCFRGFQVGSNTESLGRYTTISVVNAIFLVIACDALFSVILTELGI
ncbi:MAG: phospholipid/cholesterol/gamma-HCH transport system permease protein [Psychromonas sp.]|jgi:phospholipid/cholesterol/gamma-HCH transport system permease protein|uniref:ABC transporter permease n=1 Tax=Psychromonas sp. TaxID=1884585 RepID=UPI0039E65B6B